MLVGLFVVLGDWGCSNEVVCTVLVRLCVRLCEVMCGVSEVVWCK